MLAAGAGADYSYEADPDRSGRGAIAVPTEPAEVTAVLVPTVGPPEMTQAIESDAFWRSAQRAKGPFLRLSPVAQSEPPTSWSVLIGLLSIALVAGALGLLSWQVMRFLSFRP